MAVKPNKEGFDRAKKLIQEGHFVWDDRRVERTPADGRKRE